MNRSFIAPESKMQDAFKQRQQQLGALRSSVRAKDRDDELALFLEMRNREKERGDLVLRAAEDFDGAAALGSNLGNSPLFNVPSSMAALVRKTGADDFLNSENDKNDYDWLLTPPGTPLFPSLEMESTKTVMSQLGAPTLRPTSLKARLANPPSEHTGRSNLVSKQPASAPGLTSSGGGIRRPSSAGNLSELAGRSNLVSKLPASSPGLTSSVGGTRRSSSSGNLGSRSATPTGRPTLTTVSKSSRPSTPTSRTTIPSTRAMVATTKTSVSSAKPMVSATKAAVSVARTTTVPAAKTTIPSRSSTPLSRSTTPSRSTTRSSTPTTRTTLSASRPTSRASTPTRRPTTPSNVSTVSSLSVKTSSISKSAPVMSRQPITSPGTSPNVKPSPRPWKPSEMPGFSLDAPPNLRTTLPERPLSTTRGRPGAPGARSSSVEPASIGRPRRQSNSPSRGRSSNGISHPTGSSMPAVNRGYSRANDNVSPVVMGTKMVERVINMRKLAPPRLDDKNSSHNLSGKSSSSPDTSGFGRSLSKKSLDMAIRHMDIRRRVPGNLRSSLMTNIPASSMYSVRSGPPRSRTVSISGSPHATSSNASSEVSVNPNGVCLYNSEIDDDIGSERSGQSPASVRGR
ncbi:hypothetical protein PHAVU_008G224800 [Phaseolus vulgaris]|uniref:Uncharacterized protein n=1 Tax=Phaseolus vulgaris TaxID=3885 RepID=V7B874_PHAVU|nr:hypothetical protein PHAVU_008G224800g [Phaseolus vulgaris]ESW13770.1 hypothetical protein PHAVU_008G224800g [Phaseolus vulgaris]